MDRKSPLQWFSRIDPMLVLTIAGFLILYGGERTANAETQKKVVDHAELIQKMDERLGVTNERLARIEAQIAFLVREAQK
jgi:hypothetical protein